MWKWSWPIFVSTDWTIGVRIPVEARRTSRPALGPSQPHIQCVTGYFPEGNQPEREVNHSLHSVPRIRTSRAIPLLPPLVFMVSTVTTLLSRYVWRDCEITSNPVVRICNYVRQ
jgi:hypothetical protein